MLGVPELKVDPRYDNGEKRVKNEEVLMPLIRAEFEKNTSSHWAELLTEVGVMNCIVQDYGAFLDRQHTKESGAVAYIDYADAGSVPMPQAPGVARSPVTG